MAFLAAFSLVVAACGAATTQSTHAGPRRPDPPTTTMVLPAGYPLPYPCAKALPPTSVVVDSTSTIPPGQSLSDHKPFHTMIDDSAIAQTLLRDACEDMWLRRDSGLTTCDDGFTVFYTLTFKSGRANDGTLSVEDVTCETIQFSIGAFTSRTFWGNYWTPWGVRFWSVLAGALHATVSEIFDPPTPP